MSETKAVVLDVRQDLSHGREPFGKIMEAVSRLPEGRDLVLVAPFEPVPLYHVLEAQGFGHEARTIESGDWEVRFSRKQKGAGRTAVVETQTKPENCVAATLVEVDARGLEPPQPMIRILEAVAALPAGSRLRAVTDRRPMHLYAQLEERGFSARTEQQANGSFVTEIFRS